jgi:hypothetical protein
MLAPAGRGAERNVETTVPTATRSPAAHHAESWSKTSRTSKLSRQGFEGGQRVTGDEPVHMGKRSSHAGLHGLIAGLAPVRVDPDDPVR